MHAAAYGVSGHGGGSAGHDGGATWEPMDVPEETMVVVGAADGSLYAAALDGEVARVSRSADRGASWEPINR